MVHDREVPIPRNAADAGPVTRVWVIAESMPSASRKEILAACKKAGVNKHTAATQYAWWKYSKRQRKVMRAVPAKVRNQILRQADVEVRA